MKHYKCEKYTFKDFTFAFANNFKNYLLNDIPEINKKGVSEVYALGLVKKFKTIFHQAVEEEIITKNFFKSLKLSSKSPRKPRLNIVQLRAIKSLETNLSIREELCRDLIVFQSLVGLAYKDTLTLPKTCIERRSNGETKLDTSRIKTNEFVQQFLPSQAVEIIDKYINLPHASSSDYIFPPIDNSDYNKILKLIALKAGIHFKLQTHTGRHSYRQLLPEAGIEDSAIINRMMGKKNKDQVDETYYEVTESRLLEAKRKFELYLTKHLHHDNV
jgi:integrase